jgi:hypothetical protein
VIHLATAAGPRHRTRAGGSAGHRRPAVHVSGVDQAIATSPFAVLQRGMRGSPSLRRALPARLEGEALKFPNGAHRCAYLDGQDRTQARHCPATQTWPPE